MNLKLLTRIIKNPITDLRNIGYGPDVLKDSNPHVYQVYLAIDTEKIYYCLVDGAWICYNELNIVTEPVSYWMPAVDGDPGQQLKTDGNGNLYWSDPGEGLLPSSTIEKHDKIVTVAANSLITIVTYTATADMWLTGCITTGEIPAEFTLMVNLANKGVCRTSQQDRTGRIMLPQAIKILSGDIITVKVIHFETDDISNYDATIYGYVI